jgi:hypothetical protein
MFSDIFFSPPLEQLERFHSMRRFKDKTRRFVKYWSVRYKQASGQERLHLGVVMLMVAYVWWVMALS